MNASEQQSVSTPTDNTGTKAGAAKPRAHVSRLTAKPKGLTRKPKRPSQATARKGTKTAKILALLGRADGASLQELRKSDRLASPLGAWFSQRSAEEKDGPAR